LKYLTNLAPYSPDWYYHNLASNEKQGIRDWQQAIQEARGRREQISALLQAALDKTLKFEPAARAEIDYEHGRFQYYGAKWEEALASYREALTSFQQVDDHPGQAKVLQAIGDIQRILGEQENALESYEQALAAFKQVDDRPGQAKVLQAIGDVQRLRNEQGTALQNYEQALNLFQRLQDQPQEAKVLEAMGDVQRLRDQLDAALRSYQQALALYQEEQDRPKRAKVLKAIGDIQRLRQDERAALESYGQALAIFGDLKEPVEEANVRQAMHEMQHINNDRTTVPGSFEQSYPKTLESVLTTRNRSWLAWIAVPIAFVLTLGLLLVGLPQVFPEQPPAPTLAQHAQGVVEQFYQHINARDYADAYKLLKTNSAQDGYCSLVNGYMLTEHDGVTYNGVTTLPDGTFKVAVTIVATELFATGTVKTTYDGYEVVDPGMWQIKSGGRLDRIGRVPVPTPPPSPDPLQAAQAVVQQYHSDINARNYPHAFSLWGADFHSITDYCTFVEGFSRTRSDDVHIDDTTLLSNGIVQVVATVNATEDTGSGTTMKVYHETYIVWQEHNGAWRILRGTLI